jgi:hypothetical protein
MKLSASTVRTVLVLFFGVGVLAATIGHFVLPELSPIVLGLIIFVISFAYFSVDAHRKSRRAPRER